MKQISKLWAMAYDNYVDTKWENIKGTKFIMDMEETLLYWWPRASCEELKQDYANLKIKVEARKRLIKTLKENCGQ